MAKTAFLHIRIDHGKAQYLASPLFFYEKSIPPLL